MHPDRHAASGDAERRASLQLTTRLNEAYRALKDPVQRGKHLLELQGIDVGFETNTQMPSDFLLEQLELREQLDAAKARKDVSFLHDLAKKLEMQGRHLESEIARSLDDKKDYAQGAELVRKLMFLQKIEAEIDSAYESIE